MSHHSGSVSRGLNGQAEHIACTHISAQGKRHCRAAMIHETRVSILLNGSTVATTQCLAADLEQMAVGFLLSQGMLQERGQVRDVRFVRDAGRVEVRADSAPGNHGLALDPAPVASRMQVDAAVLLEVANSFNRIPGLHRDSRFVHSAGLADGSGALRCRFEDIGRHNAIDKALGEGVLQGWRFSDLMLLCTCRFSCSVVEKAARVGIPVCVSPAAASIEAADLAARVDMTLCGRVRPAGAVLYAGTTRVVWP